jgi:thiol-disulfide isomerase/thioredoxin
MSHLLNFYGKECPHCEKMHTVVERLNKEEGIEIERLEVWHDNANLQKLKDLDPKEECGGVPYFYNTKTNKSICGEASYEELKSWATE